jgi:hypothetical protein
VAEPLVFAIPVLFVWRAVRDPNEHGISLMPMLWSGYLPLLLFRHLGGRTRTTGRRWTALEIAVIRSRRAGSTENGCGLSMSSFISDG